MTFIYSNLGLLHNCRIERKYGYNYTLNLKFSAKLRDCLKYRIELRRKAKSRFIP